MTNWMLISYATGELEKTLFERMCMAQKLNGLISSCDVMGHRLEPFVDRLEGFLNPTIKGTIFENLRSMDMQDQITQGEECWLGMDVLECLDDLLVCIGEPREPTWVLGGRVQGTKVGAKARQFTKFIHRGAIFSPSSFSLRDSRVVIGKGNWYAGEIKQIIAYPSSPPSNIYFVIQKFKELSTQEALKDPYRKHPFVGGRLYHPELESKIEVLPSQVITTHFAHTPHDKETFGFPCFHALPLDKVIDSHRRITVQ